MGSLCCSPCSGVEKFEERLDDSECIPRIEIAEFDRIKIKNIWDSPQPSPRGKIGPASPASTTGRTDIEAEQKIAKIKEEKASEKKEDEPNALKKKDAPEVVESTVLEVLEPELEVSEKKEKKEEGRTWSRLTRGQHQHMNTWIRAIYFRLTFMINLTFQHLLSNAAVVRI